MLESCSCAHTFFNFDHVQPGRLGDPSAGRRCKVVPGDARLAALDAATARDFGGGCTRTHSTSTWPGQHADGSGFMPLVQNPKPGPSSTKRRQARSRRPPCKGHHQGNASSCRERSPRQREWLLRPVLGLPHSARVLFQGSAGGADGEGSPQMVVLSSEV